MKNEETIRFVREHREQDVRSLALQARRDGAIDLTWALDQIVVEGQIPVQGRDQMGAVDLGRPRDSHGPVFPQGGTYGVVFGKLPQGGE